MSFPKGFEPPEHIISINYHNNESGKDAYFGGNYGQYEGAIGALEDAIDYLKQKQKENM